MRRLPAALLLAAIAVALTACGGGGEATTDQPVSGAVAPPPAVATPAGDIHSPTETAGNEQFPTTPDSVPQAVLSRLSAKQPMLIYFFDSSQVITRDQRREVDWVAREYRGLIDLMAYDEDLALRSREVSSSVELQKAMTMAGLVGVKHAPYLLFVDRAGRITGRFAGFTDRTLLEREVLRATE